ncbi:hypothetical protein Skr01_32870 [Sphaerisporangium krabiense]|uniref:Chitodextrinase n=1 Tax=Sphaerisporangium krabiense TaxID=763782 RepID=A0A7W8Z0Z1_9ACTN|nr:carbohydrate-binding protein [Sphaerisporangium krabiense]MBB5625469.1 chitodextrinase [Sphaerisporangium krabiense]GII63202.1 hypothetical protein Skr01_32870 [Sphaerisporangium krabiense]
MRFRVLILAVVAVFVTGLGLPAPAGADAARQASVQAAAPDWAPFTAYTVGTVVSYNGVEYRCLQTHTSMPGWEPATTPVLWQPVTVLPVPANVRVTGATSSSLSLAWDASGDTVTGYRIYEGGTQRAQVTTTTATISDLGKCETHKYTIKTYNGNGESAGRDVRATTMDCTLVSWVVYAPYTAGTVVVHNGVTYQCLQNHTSLPGWEPPNVPSLWERVRPWEPSTAYNAGTVVTYNGVTYQGLRNHTSAPGQEPEGDPALWQRVTRSDDVEPSFPANLRVTGTTSGSVSLAWDASTDDVRLAGYEVYRGNTLVAAVPDTSYTDSGLAASTTYTYMLRARDAAGNRSDAAWVTATTAAPAPGQPGTAWATANNTSVTLTWGASSGTVTGYRIYEGGTQRAQVTTTTATVSGLGKCETHKYTIKAYNVSGESAGREVSATTTGCTSPNPNPSRLPGAPYLYMGSGNPPNPGTVMVNTGIKSFTMAYIQATGGCNPAWDGLRPLTGGIDASAINTIRSMGGSVGISFGGWSGDKLGPYCPNPPAFAQAVQKVIDALHPAVVDFDIENADEFENYTVQDRILNGLKIVRQNNPNVKITITIPTLRTGLNPAGIRLVNQAKALGAPIDNYTIMAFDFGGIDMYQDTVNASEGLKSSLKSVFGWSDAEAYAHMGISGMNGTSDWGETTTPAQWTQIRDWAKTKGLTRLTFWAVNRDQPGWQFTQITAGF